MIEKIGYIVFEFIVFLKVFLVDCIFWNEVYVIVEEVWGIII